MLKKEILEARNEYISRIKKDLLGPGSEISLPDEEHELISDRPNTRYSIGILYTQGSKMGEGTEESEPVDDEEILSGLKQIEEVVGEKGDDSVINENSEDEDNDNLDNEIVLATQNRPSSMGITFLVKGDSDSLKCRLKFATYRKATSDDCRIPLTDDCLNNLQLPVQFEQYVRVDKEEKTLKLMKGGFDRKTVSELKEKDLLDTDEYKIIDKLYKLERQLCLGYVRVPHEEEAVLDFHGSNYMEKRLEIDKEKGIFLKVTSLRRKMQNDIYSITVMMVNDSNQTGDRINADHCIFQPEIKVLSSDNNFCFIDYAGGEDFNLLDDEEKSLALQYRNKKIYASGLGTSAGWDVDDSGKGQVNSDFFPSVEIPSMDFKLRDKYAVSDEVFSMKYLSDLNKEDKETKIKQMGALVSKYKQWIEDTEEKSQGLDSKFQDISKKNINGCKESVERMDKGLKILQANKEAWDAFQLANRAMFMQRVHLKLQEDTSDIVRYPDDETISDKLEKMNYTIEKDVHTWRPFQLAFILMSIEAIVDEKCSDRNLVDLIWFPTGGGKTEAYLGLTAFTIFYRRLAHNKEDADGTTVIMRYTLRLLAAQQFTRASTLICACEYIRNDAIGRRPVYGKYDLGKKAITIGLWIGGEHTPNKNDDAKSNIKKLLAGSNDLKYRKDQYNKFQVLKCPWCGTSLVQNKDSNNNVKGTFGYKMKNNSHFRLFCPQEYCFFEDELPIQVVDEELYKNPPTLLFGTVDKFAMLPWNKEIGNFFAVQSNNRAPELIIQDELHLISGPLGTMVGLYETAIDALCTTDDGVKPKIIASTATIRRAVEQCAALYDREVVQFPHPGIDAEDSFFAREANIDYSCDKFGRIYVGLMPSGKSKAMMENRSMASLLQSINTMDLNDEVKDKFWTLTAYFNSLKDLGKCATLVNDDVKDFIRRSAYRLGGDPRLIGTPDELTSRVSTTRLNETLDKLEKCCYCKDYTKKDRWPVSVLLATNMISVGIDVARLNVMLMVGQPKLTSEYIQASSRVGRSYPGVVFAMYDSSKSRDRSHYEQFKGFHESFYRFVEPTGVTPFSKPARERALHAVIIGYLRHKIKELSEDKKAADFRVDDFKDEITVITDFIINRCRDISARVNDGSDTELKDIREEIDHVLSYWDTMAKDSGEYDLYYGYKFMIQSPNEGEKRLLKVFNSARSDHAFDTMTSLRNVDSMVAGNIVIWENK